VEGRTKVIILTLRKTSVRVVGFCWLKGKSADHYTAPFGTVMMHNPVAQNVSVKQVFVHTDPGSLYVVQ
jgi:hypothetical protein